MRADGFCVLVWAGLAVAGTAHAQGAPAGPVGISLSALGFVDGGADGEVAGRLHLNDGAGAVGFWAAAGARYESDWRARTSALAEAGLRLAGGGTRVRVGLSTELRFQRAVTAATGLSPEQLDSVARGIERPTENGPEPIVAPDGTGGGGYTAATVASLVGGVEWQRGDLTVSLETGLPMHGDVKHRPWVAGTVGMGIAPRLALVAGLVHRSAAAGDTRGRRHLALGLTWRAGFGPRPAATGDSPRGPRAPGISDAAESFAADRLPGAVRLRIRAPGAGRVEVRSNLTAWLPRALAADTLGWWSVTLPAARGVHRLVVRYGATDWVAPPGLMRAPDGFGGWVGLLYVE